MGDILEKLQQYFKPGLTPASPFIEIASDLYGKIPYGTRRNIDDLLESSNYIPQLAVVPAAVKLSRKPLRQMAEEVLSKRNTDKWQELINARNLEFHATPIHAAEKILESGLITPGGAPAYNFPKSPKAYEKTLKKLEDIRKQYADEAEEFYKANYPAASPASPNYEPGSYDRFYRQYEGLRVKASNAFQDYISYRDKYAIDPSYEGVSLVRYPEYYFKGGAPVAFGLDPSKLPPRRPYTEPGYRKTNPYDLRAVATKSALDLEQKIAEAAEKWFGTTGGPMGESSPQALSAKKVYEDLVSMRDPTENFAKMNPRFEGELRTYGTAIPKEAVREVWINRKKAPFKTIETPILGELSEVGKTRVDIIDDSSLFGKEISAAIKGWEEGNRKPLDILLEIYRRDHGDKIPLLRSEIESPDTVYGHLLKQSVKTVDPLENVLKMLGPNVKVREFESGKKVQQGRAEMLREFLNK